MANTGVTIVINVIVVWPETRPKRGRFPYVNREIYPLTEDAQAKQIVAAMKQRMA